MEASPRSLSNTDGSDGTQSVTSSTPGVCITSGLVVTYLTAGTCTLTAQTAATTNFAAASGSPQSFTVAPGDPRRPDHHEHARQRDLRRGLHGDPSAPTGDGTQSVTSNTPDVCSTSGLAVTYVGVGTCSLSAQVAPGVNYLAASGAAQTFTIGRATPTTPTITEHPVARQRVLRLHGHRRHDR